MKYLLPFFVLLFIQSYSQETFDIKDPGTSFPKKCGECLQMINSRPKEVGWGIHEDENHVVFFAATNANWFFSLINKPNDGLTVDIVTKDSYACGGEKRKPSSWASRGELLPPVYFKDMKKIAQVTPEGYIIVPIGTLPEKFMDKDYELNLVLLKNKNLCYYQSFFELERSQWDLLDMGLFMDTLTYRSNLKNTNEGTQSVVIHNKRMKFEIPFEKNKSSYSANDVKPLYDSLKLTDYTIQSIEIRAYSSIEGTEENNLKLQEERAQSIIQALKSYQTTLPIEKVQASENWVEFYTFIQGTPYERLAKLSKEQVKKELIDKKLSNDLEPFFQKQRKAIIVLDLVKKSRIDNLNETQILEAFNTSVADKNIAVALEIQTSVFNKIIDHQLPSSLASKLEVPRESEFGYLMNNQTAFKYFVDELDMITTFGEFKALLDIYPNNGRIRYNLLALTFDILKLGLEKIDPKELEKSIKDLAKYRISGNLIKRMMINYHIVMSEFYMMQGDYTLKDKSLKYIYTNYKTVPYTESDVISLAKYFAYYAQYDWSEKLLSPYINKIDVDEDLLFYYLNLTIVDSKKMKKEKYRTTLLNATNINKKRFCKMFNPINKGGVSFQLLENDFLKDIYCESCRDGE